MMGKSVPSCFPWFPLTAAWLLCGCDICHTFVPSSFQIRRQGTFTFVEFGPSLTSLSVAGETASFQTTESTRKPRVAVVGGGWAGYSAADALSTDSSVEVVLLDASPRGSGGLAGGWRTPSLGYPVEAGIHGFWREYRNTFKVIESLGLDLDSVLSPFTPSILVSKNGRQALAPVLGKESDGTNAAASQDVDLSLLANPTSAIQALAELLPPPLDVALLADFDPNSGLTMNDRLSGVGLLGAWADFEQESTTSWERYDKLSAENLFRSAAGITPALYTELVSPLLHVLPMTTGYDCSAAAALSCFHCFALQTRGAFDVRWPRGTIAEKIFQPWTEQLESRGNVDIQIASKVTSVVDLHGESGAKYQLTINNSDIVQCDAVVFAVGATAMKRLVPSCPALQSIKEAKQFRDARGVTCVAVRLFLKPSPTTSGLEGGMYSETQLPPEVAQAMKDSPVIVCGPSVGGIPELVETGFCIYDLSRMQDEFSVGSNKRRSDANTSPECSAIEIDFFRADAIADIQEDRKVAELALKALKEALNLNHPVDPGLILDMSVVRARDAVSHFCVGSASWSPSIKLANGIYMCGDWIDRSGHASWSTEKAVVTGRQAAACVATDLGLLRCNTTVIPAATDTKALSALRQVSKALRSLLPNAPAIPPAPWTVAARGLATIQQRRKSF